jgi:hypothetical protein
MKEEEEEEDVMEEFLTQHRQRAHSEPPPSTIVGVSLRLRVVWLGGTSRMKVGSDFVSSFRHGADTV